MTDNTQSATQQGGNAASGTPAGRETLGFQAEVKQLLHLMIQSLYSN